MDSIARACSVYCEGPLLEAVQLSGIYNDSKTFVDMPMRFSPEDTLSAFYNLTDPNGNTTELEIFLNEYFEEAGSDLVSWLPPDFQETPYIVADMDDAYEYKSWTSDLNQLWKVLGRNISQSVVEYPERHSFLPRNHPMVVPGGRFRESYYWDSWWIVRGLLICEMFNTSKGVIQNLLDDVDHFGFVPNGGRIYYLDRSQPPLLSEMVWDYFTHTLPRIEREKDTEKRQELLSFLNSSFDLLQREYAWWMDDDNGHVVTLHGTESGTDFRLNRYYSNYTTPRPESYAEDYETALQAAEGNEENKNETINAFYRNIRAGAETGWDFSSRWLRDSHNLTTIATSEIIPIELNAILYQMELKLMQMEVFLTANDFAVTSTFNYTQAARERYAAIHTFLWDNSSFHWRDFNLSSQSWVSNGDEYSTIAYFLPLWAKIYPPPPQLNLSDFTEYSSAFVPWDYEPNSAVKHELVRSLRESRLLQAAGVLTTTLATGQQWDSPNAWPPLVLLTIEGLRALDSLESRQMANNISTLWLNTCYLAYNRTGYMYEKYNAFEVGVGGGGGEYTPQVGFGWSNAVALILINETYSEFVPPKPIIDEDDDDDWFASVSAIATLSVLIPLLCMGFLYWFYFFVHQPKKRAESLLTVHLVERQSVVV